MSSALLQENPPGEAHPGQGLRGLSQPGPAVPSGLSPALVALHGSIAPFPPRRERPSPGAGRKKGAKEKGREGGRRWGAEGGRGQRLPEIPQAVPGMLQEQGIASSQAGAALDGDSSGL